MFMFKFLMMFVDLYDFCLITFIATITLKLEFNLVNLIFTIPIVQSKAYGSRLFATTYYFTPKLAL